MLDGPDPGAPLRIRQDPERLNRTAFVVTGDDPATEALREVFAEALREEGLSPDGIARRFVTVAEPGAAAAKHAAETGLPLVEAPAPTAFGALSPYALVPAALAGADIATLLEEATAVLPSLTRPENNPGLVLGAILGGAARPGGGRPCSAATRRRCRASPDGRRGSCGRRPAAGWRRSSRTGACRCSPTTTCSC
ncbi:hypothetical protein ACFQY7_09090 [Actinomadura luteofluorescens]|uniref:hypothetical protein n=1 Tax=Actinomadura luteofluorescens TaxID=46163 RepID=UPI003631169A